MIDRQKPAADERAELQAVPQLRVVEGEGKPEEAPAPERRTGVDIRTKILSLLLLSALLPAALVGVVSYFTARNIQRQELSEQLTGRVEAIREQSDQFFTERLSDTEIFSSSFVVSQSLDAWQRAQRRGDETAALEAAGQIRAYLGEVRERYPLYRELAVLDADGRTVAGVGPAHDPNSPLDRSTEASDSYLSSVDGRPLSYVLLEVAGRAGRPIGTLRAASALDELWKDLANAQAQARGRVLVLDRDAKPLFDSDRPFDATQEPVGSEGARLSLSGASGLADYTDERGDSVVGAYLSHPQHEIGFLVEIESAEAFAVSRRLRAFAMVSSVLAAALVAGLGFWVVVGLTRPIAALVSGARAAAQGNLGVQVPVTSADEIGHLTGVFNQMVRSLKESRAKLQALSTTDELTGLHNRRHLAKMFEIELGRTRRNGRPLSVLMLDLDHFKAFNDRLGHLEGDRLLKRVGDYLGGQLRPTDVLARYGGEEFIVLLPDTNDEGARQLAERLRVDFVEATQGALAGGETPVTISIGVATTRREEMNRDQLVAAADTALYDAKREGRNRVRVAV